MTPKNSRPSSTLEFVGISRHFGHVKALDGLNLAMKPGELVALLGPSGCGKTTALRIVAGLEIATSGDLIVNGSRYNEVPASKRDMGMVFQSYSLFPNMTVAENVDYGLRARKIDKSKRMKRINDVLELVALTHKSTSYPHQLSGGQQQRVALARALAIEPTVLLLDEPLSALDAQVRGQIREEIRRIQLELGTTTLFVTHDQEEAMAISDRVGVMNQGRLEQIDTPMALYNNPATPFVASFVGSANRIPAEVTGGGNVKVLGQRIPLSPFTGEIGKTSGAIALVRPEAMTICSAQDGAATEGVVAVKSFLGATTKLGIASKGLPLIHVDLPSKDAKNIQVGDEIAFKITAENVMVEDVA